MHTTRRLSHLSHMGQLYARYHLEFAVLPNSHRRQAKLTSPAIKIGLSIVREIPVVATIARTLTPCSLPPLRVSPDTYFPLDAQSSYFYR